MRPIRNRYKISVEKQKRKLPHRRTGHRRKGNIKMDLRNMSCDGEYLIRVADDMTVVNTMNLAYVLRKSRELLSRRVKLVVLVQYYRRRHFSKMSRIFIHVLS
jgi:hypothetical protein